MYYFSPISGPSAPKTTTNSLSYNDYTIATNLVTYLILMRIDRADGAEAYIMKSKGLVLRALGLSEVDLDGD